MKLIERLKELEAKATPGPWNMATSFTETDDLLMEEMRNTLPKLLAVVERAQALVRSEHSPMLTEVRLGRRQFAKLVSALADLEGDTDEPD